MDLQLDDAVVIVTGANSGIGLATCRCLAAEGARLIGVDRALDRFVAEFPDTGLPVPTDVRERAATTAAAQIAVERHGRIDGLVNCAGIMTIREGGFLSTADDDWRTVLDVNLLGYVRMAQAVLPHMLQRRHGSIVHIASIRAHLGDWRQPDYCVSKAAVAALSNCLSLEFTSRGVRSNIVSPGSVRSDAWDTPGGIGDQLAARHGLPRDEAITHELQNVRKVPAGRPATATEVAAIVAFLLSDATAYVSGSEYAIDGGMLPTV
jgi:NAD(P)-dependent dehydrogenase (short-subunit alcohol dehydrogenase family)